MIIILKQDNSCDKAQVCKKTGELEIRYKNYNSLKMALQQNPSELNSSDIDLIIYGDHGSRNSICQLNEQDITELGKFFKNRVQRLVLDACQSACLVPKFKDMLIDKGIILCHAGICQTNSVENQSNHDIYDRWMDANKNALSVWSEGVIPAIYRKTGNTLNCYECSQYEEGVDNPFKKEEFDACCKELGKKGIIVDSSKKHADFLSLSYL